MELAAEEIVSYRHCGDIHAMTARCDRMLGHGRVVAVDEIDVRVRLAAFEPWVGIGTELEPVPTHVRDGEPAATRQAGDASRKNTESFRVSFFGSLEGAASPKRPWRRGMM